MSLLSKLKSFFRVKDNSIVLPRDVSLITREGFAPSDFRFGIEIYNDNTTPMEFVVNTLEKNLNIKRKEAIEIMLSIHTKGGVVLPLNSFEDANRITNLIMSDTKEKNYELYCRAINAQQGTQVDA
jgi:ATP-dependent Clp protease adaptor protein ClpS